MEENLHHQFFQNRECKFFPCHEGIDAEEFNCLFCYCPLYALGKKCGGNFWYNERGNKVCTDCTFPHRKENYQKIIGRYDEIMQLVRKNDSESE
ncbi:MAG: cysteine-rich small domain-containing protein [Christensenellales bacterium]|jgi:Zn-finger protein